MIEHSPGPLSFAIEAQQTRPVPAGRVELMEIVLPPPTTGGPADLPPSSRTSPEGGEIKNEPELLQHLRLAMPWCGLGFLVVWKVQSQMAATATIGLSTLVSIWTSLVVMLFWSLVATFAYYGARQRGVPDLLAQGYPADKSRRAPWLSRISGAVVAVLKAIVAGVQPFIFSRTFCRILARPAECWRTRMARTAVLGCGLTLFGVMTSHHMLREAGYPDEQALKLSLVGSLLNVTYRVFFSAILFHTVSEFLHSSFL